jgi:ABC-type sugar transport system permease subunit
MKKILVVCVIILFLGVAVAPSFNQSVVTASQDDDLVEVTTQACGIQGYDDTTVKLTREQYNDLEEYLNDFDARLKQTTTKEEVIVLYKEAIIELNDYGLLPKGMSISLAERLVIGNNLYDKLSGFFKHLPMSDFNIENMKCFVYAEANGLVIPLCVGILLLMSSVIVNKLLDQGRYSLLMFLFVFFYLPIVYPIFVVGAIFSTLNPINILSDVWLSQGENYKLTAVRYNPYKITEGDLNNHEYDLFGYTGLKLITPDIIYFFGRTLFVIQD